MSTHNIKNRDDLHGSNAKIAVILSEFNLHIGEELLKNTLDELTRLGTKDVQVIRIPGALETPLTAQKIIEKNPPDAIIALGIIIKGETAHFDHVSRESINGLMKVSLDKGVPIVQGILTTLNEKQAEERIVLGKEYAQTAISLIQTFSSL